MTFSAGNPLEQVLLTTSQGGDPQGLLDALAANPVFIPAQAPDGPGGEVPAGEVVELPVFEHQGQRFVPVFTSEEQLRIGAPAGSGFLRVSGEDLASLWPAGHALALNPGGGLSVAIPEDDVRSMSAVERIPAGSDITVGVPAQEPTDLWDQLRAWAADEPAVRSAHRALVLVHAPGQEPQMVVGVELDDAADEEAVLTRGAQALGGVAAFTRYDPAGGDPVSQWLAEQADPLYVR